MTKTPASYARFGPTLAFAERALTEVLRRHLAERQITPDTWYALRLTAMRGPKVSREALRQGLEGSRTLTADSTRELLARLESEGLIAGDTEIDLTAEGETLYRSLLEYVSGASAQLLSQFDTDDIDTTVRTLQAITERAEEGLERSADSAVLPMASLTRKPLGRCQLTSGWSRTW
jgi:DNA-binding MarR family transcriptional regulator